jgi:hypothetical protein
MQTFDYAKSIISQSAESGCIVEDVFSDQLHEFLADLGNCNNASNFHRYSRQDGCQVFVVKSQQRGRPWEIHLVDYQ